MQRHIPRSQHQVMQPAIPGTVRTKKFQLDNKTYIRLAMQHLLRTQWKWAWVPALIVVLNIVLNVTGAYRNIWIYFIALAVIIGYLLFWAIQFTGVTQMEQGKVLFNKMSYEISPPQIMMKLNAKEGMQIKWENVKQAYKFKDHFFLVLSRAQFIYLPFSIFNSDNDQRLLESLLKRKGYLK